MVLAQDRAKPNQRQRHHPIRDLGRAALRSHFEFRVKLLRHIFSFLRQSQPHIMSPSRTNVPLLIERFTCTCTGGANVKCRRKTAEPDGSILSRSRQQFPSSSGCLFPWLGRCCGRTDRSPPEKRDLVDLNLVLAWMLRERPIIRAFSLHNRVNRRPCRNPQVLAAIRAGALQTIAVSMVQWTGQNSPMSLSCRDIGV